jgi:hypothetical protein
MEKENINERACETGIFINLGGCPKFLVFRMNTETSHLLKDL